MLRHGLLFGSAFALLIAGCGPTQDGSSAGPSSSTTVARAYGLGNFPEVPHDPLPASTVSALQEVLDAAVETGMPGVTATVLAGGRGAWSGAAGTADGAATMEVGAAFNIASITKMVIAAAVMRLVEKGLLSLEDRASDHLPPDLAFDTNGATIRDLLGMHSGIPDVSPSFVIVDADPAREWTIAEILEMVPSSRTPPSAEFAYSNTNYMLLGQVIQTVTGASVADALRSDLLADPRLSALVYQPEERPDGPLAVPYIGGAARPDLVQEGGGYLRSRAAATAANSAGAMAGDSASVALFGYLAFGGELLTDSSLDAMTDFREGDEFGYGLGVVDETAVGAGFGTAAIGHGGWDDGYSTIVSVLPTEGIVVSVLANMGGDPVELVVPIAQLLIAALEP